MASLIKILDNAKFLSKTVFGDVSPNPTYQLGSSLASVNEGSSVVFTLSTTNISDGTLVPYVITGVSLADLASGALTGNFTVASGLASASITLAADALTEGSETMTVSLSSGVASASVIVNDTSRTPTYAIGRSLSAVDEGSSVVFTLSTTNVANGTVLPYTISGISSNDVTTGSLTGSFTVSNGLATATITMSADQLTEGAETATLTLNNAAASNFVVVNDTSTTPVPLTISGLQLWLDAADSSTLFDATAGGNLVTTDGAAVARWADKSGNNRHATQSTSNARPSLSVSNGRSLSFITNDFLQCPKASYLENTSQFTICAWVKKRTSNSYTSIFQGAQSQGIVGLYSWIDSNWYFDVRTPSNNSSYAFFNSSNTNWQFMSLVFDGNLSGNSNKVKAYVNANQQTPLTSNGSFSSSTAAVGNANATLDIGLISGNYTDGNFGSILIYNKALTQQELTSLFNYSKANFGL